MGIHFFVSCLDRLMTCLVWTCSRQEIAFSSRSRADCPCREQGRCDGVKKNTLSLLTTIGIPAWFVTCFGVVLCCVAFCPVDVLTQSIAISRTTRQPKTCVKHEKKTKCPCRVPWCTLVPFCTPSTTRRSADCCTAREDQSLLCLCGVPLCVLVLAGLREADGGHRPAGAGGDGRLGRANHSYMEVIE